MVVNRATPPGHEARLVCCTEVHAAVIALWPQTIVVSVFDYLSSLLAIHQYSAYDR